MERVDLTDHRFGLLVAIEHGPPRFYGKARHSTWVCRCDCGNTATVSTLKLRAGSTKTCGCNGVVSVAAGAVYGRLTAIREVEHRKWLCHCKCGNSAVVATGNLGRGTMSCGCLARESLSARARVHGHARDGHTTKEYRCWSNMLRRCYTSSSSRYAQYGGRGISVCQRWQESFENFLADMGPAPSPEHSIDREDVNGDYEPSNCTWATPAEQRANKQSSLRFNGKPLKQIATERGINYYTLRAAFRRGENPETFSPRDWGGGKPRRKLSAA